MKELTFHIHRDHRGDLIPVPFENLPFQPKHMFVISNNNGPVGRGGHAHKEMNQILFCAQGSFQVLLQKQDPEEQAQIHNVKAGQFVFHENLEWAELFIQQTGTVIISLCDRPYDENDVIRDRLEFFDDKTELHNS